MASKQRALSVVVALIFAFSVIIFAPPVVFIAITGVVALLTFNEFLRMYRVSENVSLYTISMTIFAILSIMLLFPSLRRPEVGLALTQLAILIVALVTQKIGKKKFEQVAIIIMGTVYGGFLLYYFVLIRLMSHGRELMILLCIGTWGRS